MTSASNSGRAWIVGRHRERSILRDLLDRRDEGDRGGARLAVVTGEAGIGKTTLVDELAQHARRSGWNVLRGGTDPHDVAALELWAGPCAALGVPLAEAREEA